MEIKDYYLKVLQSNEATFSNLIADAAAIAEFKKVQNFLNDFDALQIEIATRPEGDVLALAIREYSFALSAAAFSNYRHAHISLRLFFELALSAIHFSAHELNLRLWMVNSQDINWSALSDDSEGVFAKNFIRAFHPGIETHSSQYSTMAKTVYRECSEFVHGNLHTHAGHDQPVEYNQKLLLGWTARVEAIRLSLLYAYASRYLQLFGKKSQTNLEQIMLESLGQLPAIQNIYGK
jgi:hypothetical protein